ncbi:hypothetical protein JB92DRAFT_2835757 [Gautieria morchelliformis]|nr:hypothetical protein JB92DRAFT_2835757 [Gautieria morchelliformis]
MALQKPTKLYLPLARETRLPQLHIDIILQQFLYVFQVFSREQEDSCFPAGLLVLPVPVTTASDHQSDAAIDRGTLLLDSRLTGRRWKSLSGQTLVSLVSVATLSRNRRAWLISIGCRARFSVTRKRCTQGLPNKEGLLGLTEGRVTFVIGSKGVVELRVEFQ